MRASKVCRAYGWIAMHTVVAVLVMILTPSLVKAYSGDRFIEELKAKLETTSNIYLEAESVRLKKDRKTGDLIEADTASITLAYAYPNQFMQKVVGASNRRQYVIINKDSVVLSYPHLDFHRRQSLKKGQLRQLLMEHIPLAAALIGVSQGNLNKESISTSVSNDTLDVTIKSNRKGFPFSRVQGRFQRKNLVPETLSLRGRRNFQLDIIKYVEEERFPEWVEKAFSTLDTRWLEETPA